MSHRVGFSEDDDSFEESQDNTDKKSKLDEETILLSSDNEYEQSTISVCNLTSDEEELVEVNLRNEKKKIIKQLFPNKQKSDTVNFPTTSKSFTTTARQDAPRDPGVNKMIGGVAVNMPVEPYGCQIALMSKVITAIKTGKNCLLESPTGSGKTLALICGALAWQRHERGRLAKELAQQNANDYTALNILDGAVEYVGSIPKVNFSATTFGERSIYDSPMKDTSFNTKLSELSCDDEKGSDNHVKIHDKRRRLNSPKCSENTKLINTPEKFLTPEKRIEPHKAETPENVRFLVNLLRNWVTDDVNCSIPTIYYGARTHKQLQQVIKEFKRTSYCGEAKMTVLSSREHSCIREFDRKLWSSKNEMCSSCIKTSGQQSKSGCVYYDNRQSLNHRTLPPAFDLEDLVRLGIENTACPYYAAKSMASSAHIVFCPYNYLIEPSIRNSLQIDLRSNIVVIDEAHNIEDICRDAASFTFTRDNVQAALTELEKLSGYLYSNQEISSQVDYIYKTLKTWDEWFGNQMPLINNKPVNNNEAVHMWNSVDFVQTLNYHNIGQSQHLEYKKNAMAFCQRLREDPRTLLGVSQSTGTLVESLDTMLTYLFRCDGQYMDDFKPALVRTLATDHMTEAVSWKSSNFNQRIQKDVLELRLMCMNPAIVFEGLKASRCIVLASGTLTPLVSLYSELDAEFPLKVTPNHVISSDRVWVGTLSTCPDGSKLDCRSSSTQEASVQDALGQTVLWACRVTPHGVLCFMPSYQLMNRLASRWQETGLWNELKKQKHIFIESRNGRDHSDIMEDYYKYVETERGAILFAVFRGKVSEGMDFKDNQARAVITIGIPYPNTYDMAIKEKMNYNNKYEKTRNLLGSSEWLRVQAYRALNQAVGRCVRHRLDWGAVLMIDARFTNPYYTEHLSSWVRNFLNNNHHTYKSLVNSPDSLESFMQSMKILEKEDI